MLTNTDAELVDSLRNNLATTQELADRLQLETNELTFRTAGLEEISAAKTAEIDRLQTELAADAVTMPCGHAQRWQAARNPVDPQSERYCVFCEIDAANATCLAEFKSSKRLQLEIERLQAIVDRLPKDAEGKPCLQLRSEPVWRTNGPEGCPQMSRRFQNELAVFRGDVREEFLLISDCYSTREAAEQARAT